jgi:hypothetical protein
MRADDTYLLKAFSSFIVSVAHCNDNNCFSLVTIFSFDIRSANLHN